MWCRPVNSATASATTDVDADVAVGAKLQLRKATTMRPQRVQRAAAGVAAAGRLGPLVVFWGPVSQCRLVGCRVRVRALQNTKNRT